MLFTHILLYIFITVAAGSANISYSQCSIDCISTGLGASPMLFSDLSSSCKNSTLQASISECVYAKCNYTEQWTPAFVHHQLCGRVRIKSRVWPLAIAGIFCVSISLLAVVLRCCSRYAVARKFGYDDVTIVVAAVFFIAFGVLHLYNVFVNGFGRHFWNIDPSKVTQLLTVFWFAQISYIIVLIPVKTSILLFYLRIFPGSGFKVISLTTIAAVLLSGLAFIFALIFQCSPVSGVWDKSITSKCVSLNLIAYVAGGIAIALDIVILILPIPKCIELHMNTRKELGVIFIFGLGSVACATNIIRLIYIINYRNSIDQTCKSLPKRILPILAADVRTNLDVC
ncbi:hypothetical protein LAWI1_G006472 [Lachnellula willkommii]|uniref:Uncharacterized protein n=1 Tax=Lachnellula willkommii TaxID=215461 RepID=A0A559LZS7_9HELO|nr:hypothetical protein LAWI1_G006472 [Lachnellula willkommii]